ncbi:hypothetical protein Tco_0023698, partial [Tanacetum coccineum]
AQKQAVQEKQVPSPNSVFRQLIEETYGMNVCEEQKQNMEDTMLELLKDCNNVDDLFESALNSKLLSINSQHLDKEKQEVKNIAEPTAKHQTQISPCLKNFKVIHKESIIPLNKTPPVSSIMEYEDSLIMRNEELSTIPEKESDEFIKSSVEDLIPIPRESEDTSGKNIESKDSYVSNLDEPALLVTPLFDANEDEYFDPGGDADEIEFLLHRDPSTPKISVASILEGFTDEPPLEENDDLFDLES